MEKGSRNEDYPGRTELIAYLSFLNYADQLIGQAHPAIAESLADCLCQEFFPTVIQPRYRGQLVFPNSSLILPNASLFSISSVADQEPGHFGWSRFEPEGSAPGQP